MKTIGLLGGMSWESTQVYYQAINKEINARLGGLHSAQIALYSVDFDPIEKWQHHGNWTATASQLCEAARKVEAAGADFLLICTNTMHKVYEEISESISIPIIHIADATAASLKHNNLKTVGLLGTKFTMEEDFYRKRLQDHHNINVIIPEPDDRLEIHRIIYDELCLGIINQASKDIYLSIIDKLTHRGAEAIILGCTEIGLLVSAEDTNAILVDTTKEHSSSAVEAALA